MTFARILSILFIPSKAEHRSEVPPARFDAKRREDQWSIPPTAAQRATSWFVARRPDPLSYGGVEPRRGHPESHRDIHAGDVASCC